LDAGYRGKDKGADWVEKTLGWSVDLVERPRKPAPEEVLKSWAREWVKEGVAVDWQRLLPPKGFRVLPRRRAGGSWCTCTSPWVCPMSKWSSYSSDGRMRASVRRAYFAEILFHALR
jgi:hypothetical protein